MSAPPAAFPYTGHHGAYHTDDGEESYYGIEPTDDDVRDDDPVERLSWSLEMSVESFLYHTYVLFLFSKRFLNIHV